MAKTAKRLSKPAVHRLLLLGVLACAGTAAWRCFPREIADLATWPERAGALGIWAPLALAAICIPSAVLMVPASWITLLGAFTLGFARSLVPLSVGHLLGSCAAFLVGRYLARGWVERRLAGNTRLEAIDRAVAKQGFRIVLLSRLSPLLPFGVVSYSFGLTNIPLRKYALATWLGMTPGTLLYVYLGAAAKEIGDVFSGRAVDDVVGRTLFFVGLAATLAVTIVITRIAGAALREVLAQDPRKG
ncbi:MAG TPA: VTT domain-containing protein [Pirellulales bacterium]|nr:VTT domain-containing protein [Pirellulales bacterium]